MLKKLREYLGKALRGLFRQDYAITVWFGALKGLKWLVHSGNNSYFLGYFEPQFTQTFKRIVQPGDIVYDVGANVGYYTLIASTIVGIEGCVYSFEPLPRNLEFLRQHCRINGRKNVTVIDAAVSSRTGTRRFTASQHGAMAHLSAKGELEVRSVVLDNLIDTQEIKPANVIKIDVEGMEYWVLKGGERLIDTYQPIIFLATHGKENRQACLDYLHEKGYKLTEIGNGNLRNADFFAVPASSSPAK